MLKIFKLPAKSNWIDVGLYESSGYYKLIQMRYRLDNNKKYFRTVSLGFVNDYRSKEDIYNEVLKHNSNESNNN